jgi:ABC-2 type transport system ATP-binding protein
MGHLREAGLGVRLSLRWPTAAAVHRLALVNDPELVFLDEMTTGLDPTARRLAWDLVRQVRERGTTVVLVTHFMDEAETLCDRIAVFRGGEVLAVDTPVGLVGRVTAGTSVTFSAPDGDLPWLCEVAGVDEVRREGSNFTVRGDGPLLAHVAAALVAHGIAPLIWMQRPTPRTRSCS